MLYKDINKNSITISKAKTLFEMASNRVKLEKANSKAFHIHNEGFNELIVKLGVNPKKKNINRNSSLRI